jgi:protein-S-isoprenylcysteine O-methyltransferase Ste14
MIQRGIMTRFERAFVWLGGAAFVMSLAACAVAYGIFWAAPREFDPRTGWSHLAVNTLLFTLFAVHHSVFARESVKAWLAPYVPEHLVRSVYVWTASVLLNVVVGWWQPIGGELFHHTGWQALIHTLIQLTGVWLIARSVGVIDPLELAGIRQGAATGGLQIRGPYQLVRHPLYLGWMLIVFGAAHMTGDRLAFAVMTSIYLVAAIPWEERSLERVFGDMYRRYREDVKWRILPYVY